MRLFVALVLPTEVLEHLAAEIERVRAGSCEQPADLAWTPSSSWHLTLAFLGEVDEATSERLGERLERAAARHRECTLAVSAAGRFDGRVLWAGVTGEREPVGRLAASVSAAARREGLGVEERRYRPHVTLARARRPLDLRPYVQAMRGYAGPGWTAREVTLVRSRLGEGDGGQTAYDALASWPLRAATARR